LVLLYAYSFCWDNKNKNTNLKSSSFHFKYSDNNRNRFNCKCTTTTTTTNSSLLQFIISSKKLCSKYYSIVERMDVSNTCPPASLFSLPIIAWQQLWFLLVVFIKIRIVDCIQYIYLSGACSMWSSLTTTTLSFSSSTTNIRAI
jgi:hypothetical protein